MFVSEKASAYGGFVLGILGLIGAGALGSMFLNHRTASFGAGKAIDREIAENLVRLESLHNQIEALNDRVRDELTPRKACEEQIRSFGPEVAQQQAQLNDLRHLISDSSDELSSIQKEGRAYRDRYRAQVRKAAVGEKIADLVTRSGKHFQNAEITDVSSAGMTIRHEAGMNRLAPSELDPKWSERFQWNPEELAPASTPSFGGSSPLAVIPESSPKDIKVAVAKLVAPARNKVPAEVLEQLRNDVRNLVNIAGSAQVKVDNARDQAATSRSRSVPGTIETWEQRISALERDLAKANARAEAARQKLAGVSPNDAVLSLSH